MLGLALGDAIGELAFHSPHELALRSQITHASHLIYTDDPMWSGLVGYLLKRRFRLPLLVMCHSDYYSSPAWRRVMDISDRDLRNIIGGLGLLGLPGFSAPFYASWGIWLYIVLMLCALALELFIQTQEKP